MVAEGGRGQYSVYGIWDRQKRKKGVVPKRRIRRPYNHECIVRDRRLRYCPDLMGEPAKPPIRPSTNSSNFDSIHTTLQARRDEHALRVLIADDYEAVRVGLSTLLRSADIEVCAQATNGEEAVVKSIQLRPDLIILDISMPGIGGVEAARQIRVFLPEVPILFFTTHNSPQLLALSKLVGAQGFITKNETAVMLLKAVDALRNGKTFFNS